MTQDMMRQLKVYSILVGLGWKQQWANRASIIATCFLYVTLLVLMGTIWRLAFEEGTLVGTLPFTLSQVLMYIAFAEMITVGLPGPFKRIQNLYLSGTLTARLHYPISFIFSESAFIFGQALANAAAFFIVAFVCYNVIAPDFTIYDYISAFKALPMVIVMMIAYLLLQAGVGLLAVWTPHPRPINMILSKITMICGLFPIEIYPDKIQEFLLWIPFTAYMYLPSSLIYQTQTDAIILRIALMIFWLIMTTVLIAMLERKTMKTLMKGG